MTDPPKVLPEFSQYTKDKAGEVYERTSERRDERALPLCTRLPALAQTAFYNFSKTIIPFWKRLDEIYPQPESWTKIFFPQFSIFFERLRQDRDFLIPQEESILKALQKSSQVTSTENRS